jgi:hypothetical protein
MSILLPRSHISRLIIQISASIGAGEARVQATGNHAPAIGEAPPCHGVWMAKSLSPIDTTGSTKHPDVLDDPTPTQLPQQLPPHHQRRVRQVRGYIWSF